MKQTYYLTTGIVSLILLILFIYFGNIWMINQSIRQISDIQIEIDAENRPPPPEYFKAYAWLKWGGYFDMDRSYYNTRNTLSATFGDFNYDFGSIFTDSISSLFSVNVWDTTNSELKRRLLSMDELKLLNEPFYNILYKPRDVSSDFLKRELTINKLDKKKYSYLFDFLTESNALQNTCKGWLEFLELYAKEEKDSSALNCCQDILDFRPHS